MVIFLWILFAVLWLPAGALAYRFSRWLSDFDIDKEGRFIRLDSTPSSSYRNWAIVCGYLSYFVTVVVIIIIVVITIVVYGYKFLIKIAGN